MSPLFSLLALTPAFQSHTVWLETLNLDNVKQGWGAPQRNLSVEGHPLKVGGKSYAHGIGSHSNGEIDIDLHRSVERFTADVGVDDDSEGKGSCRFEIWVDGKQVGHTPTLKSGEPAIHFDIPLHGARRLTLIITDAGDGDSYDHGEWVDAKFEVRPGGRAPVTIGFPVEKPMAISMKVSPKPVINGARRFGCTPGNPFLYKIAATGAKPLSYAVTGLPAGINIDSRTGLLTGSLRDKGVYEVNVTVSNRLGKAHRKLEIVAGEHALALTPPMGWNSWNVWGTAVTAQRVRAAADSFVKSGLIDYGYRTINIDDAWEGTRDSNGEIQTNPKFGDMRKLADYIHGKGMTLGIYSSPGPKTCAGYEGSYQHEEQDAKTYGQWGIDYLKYDWCSYGNIMPRPTLQDMKDPYIKMRAALDNSGRDITFSLCQYGMGDVYNWGKSIGGNLWRTTGDINDSYDSMAGIAFSHSPKASGAGPGGWNDPDMLVVGRLGWGENPHPTKLTGNEQITHITMWSLLAAPLILGCDLTRLDTWTKALVCNPEVLDIDQDPLGRPATRVWAKNGIEVWARHLYDGSVAVGLMNRGRKASIATLSLKDLGLKGPQPIRNLWTRKSAGNLATLKMRVPAHGAQLLRVGRIAKD